MRRLASGTAACSLRRKQTSSGKVFGRRTEVALFRSTVEHFKGSPFRRPGCLFGRRRTEDRSRTETLRRKWYTGNSHEISVWVPESSAVCSVDSLRICWAAKKIRDRGAFPGRKRERCSAASATSEDGRNSAVQRIAVLTFHGARGQVPGRS